jgi:AraC-like DNA-binding protein
MIKDDVVKTDAAYTWFSMSDIPRYVLHCHAEYEVYYFIRGDVEYRIEGRPYNPRPGSLFLIPPNSIHGVTIKTAEPYERASIHFLPELLDCGEQALLLAPFQRPGRYYPDLTAAGLEFFVRSIMDCKDMERPLQRTALKHRIITLLTRVYQIHRQDSGPAAPRDERIQAVQNYLDSNLRETIPLDALSRKFGVSKNHLNVLFRREMGTTVNQYVRIKRLVWARQEMQQGAAAEEAAYKVGFNDYSNFYRAYREFFRAAPSSRSDDGIEAAIKNNLPYL